jgi:hypothetical protein
MPVSVSCSELALYKNLVTLHAGDVEHVANNPAGIPV